MNASRLSSLVRLLVILCAILLLIVLVVPLWRIDLDAPQYPEGLRLLIYPHKLAGNVDIINGLNHYIGMKTLHSDDFIEFKLLPYIIGFFAAFCLLVSAIGKRILLNILLIVFFCFGVISMIDFWKWEYDYGHNLNPEAAIIVPGMAYQPPLIGFKQLLNFGAYSIPDIGGWLFIAVGIILSLCVFLEYRRHKKIKAGAIPLLLLTVSVFGSCNVEPEQIKVGKDVCQYCNMTISDVRFGAEAITKKGKIYMYDELHCILSDIHQKSIDVNEIKDIYVSDFCGKHDLIAVNNAFCLYSEALKSPMGGNVAAFSNEDSLHAYSELLDGNRTSWKEMSK